MKRFASSLTTLLLFVSLIAVCAFAGLVAFFGLWLHTYNVFTERILVATVDVSQIKEDADGEYADVVYRPAEQQSALSHLFLGPKFDQTVNTDTQQFKIYGDSVHIGGPILRFYDHLLLVNFKTIYKVGTIYGRYNFDNQKEINRKVISSFELNGGIDSTWRDISERVDQWPYNMFVDLTNISTPGVEVSRTRARSYNLYMTVNGFLWDLQEPAQ